LVPPQHVAYTFIEFAPKEMSYFTLTHDADLLSVDDVRTPDLCAIFHIFSKDISRNYRRIITTVWTIYWYIAAYIYLYDHGIYEKNYKIRVVDVLSIDNLIH